MDILAASFQGMQILFDFFSLPQTHYFSILRNHRFWSNGAWRQIFTLISFFRRNMSAFSAEINKNPNFPPKLDNKNGGNNWKTSLSR
jgi:type VI protein secretion system component VasA